MVISSLSFLVTVHYPSFSARDPTRRTRSTAEVQKGLVFPNFFCSPQYGASILIALLRFEPRFAHTTRLMFITVQKLIKFIIIIITGRRGLYVRRRPNSAELLSRHACCTAQFELLRPYGRVLTISPRERESYYCYGPFFRRTRSTAEVQKGPDFPHFFGGPQYGASILITLL